MEKLLITGVNTRPLAHSAYELGYEVYSASHFCTTDFNLWHHKKCILHQKSHESCGHFQELFHPHKLEELCSPWVDEVDQIITYTGISPEAFPSSKILGNKIISEIENKYNLYKKLKNKFNLPLTFLLSDIDEAQEISGQYPKKEFLIKPLQGSGGYGVFKLENLTEQQYESEQKPFLLQEFIKGENVSASVLCTGKEARSILSSRQLSGEQCPGMSDGFIYCGNLSPYPGEDSAIKAISEEVITELSLLGSNGVDMIVTADDVFVIEVNPRLQGTFECAESTLGINMIDAHIKACHGELIKTQEPQKFTIKKILYAPEKCEVGKINLPYVFDLPLEKTIIEKGEPVVTIITSGKTPEEASVKSEHLIKHIKEKLRPIDIKN